MLDGSSFTPSFLRRCMRDGRHDEPIDEVLFRALAPRWRAHPHRLRARPLRVHEAARGDGAGCQGPGRSGRRRSKHVPRFWRRVHGHRELANGGRRRQNLLFLLPRLRQEVHRQSSHLPQEVVRGPRRGAAARHRSVCPSRQEFMTLFRVHSADRCFSMAAMAATAGHARGQHGPRVLFSFFGRF